MDVDRTGSSNGFLWFVVGALVVAVAVLGVMYSTDSGLFHRSPAEKAANAVSDAAHDAADGLRDAARDARKAVPN